VTAVLFKLSRASVQPRTYLDMEVFIYGPVMRGDFLKMQGGEARYINCVLHRVAVSDILKIKFSAQGCLWGEKNTRTGN